MKSDQGQVKLKGGEYFLITLLDNSFSLGQFIKYTPKALNSCICVFFSNQFHDINEARAGIHSKYLKPISVVFVTYELLKCGAWEVIGNGDFHIESHVLPDHKFELSGSYKGCKIYGAGSIRKFLNAFHGLLPWKMMHDPEYFDKLMLNQSEKPKFLN